MDTENDWTFRISHILSKNVDSTPIAMGTKSENAFISNTFVPGAKPKQYVVISNVFKVVELCSSYKVVMTQFSVRPLYF